MSIKKISNILPILFIVATITFLFGSTLLPPKNQIIYGGDIYDAYFYWKSYLSESFRNGVVPFWNPYNFSGTPFLAHPDINIFYPPNWLFIILPLQYSFSWYFFIHFIWAGCTMYWLARQYTGRLGALSSAVVFSLGGYFATRVYSGHLEYVDAASWVPLVFGLVRQALIYNSKKNIILSSIVMALLIICGNELFLLFIGEILLIYIIFFAAKQKKLSSVFLGSIRGIKVLLLILLLALGFSAFQFLPRYEFISQSLRSQGLPYNVARSGSLPFEGLRLFLQPEYWGLPFVENYSYRGPWPDLTVYTHYVGIMPIILILGYIFYRLCSTGVKRIPVFKVNQDFWFLILMVIPIFILISFGMYMQPNFHELLWKFSPLYKGLRLPARHLFVVFFSLSIATGMVVGMLRSKALQITLILLMSIDLLLFDKQFFRLSNTPTVSFDQKLISALTSDAGIHRVLPDYSVVSYVRKSLDFGAAAFYNIQSTSDYNSMILNRYYQFIDLLNKSSISSIASYNVEIPPSNPYSPWIDFLNVKYILVDKQYDAIGGYINNKFEEVLEGKTYKLYKNLTVLPRFFFTYNTEIYNSDKELEKKITAENPDVRHTVLFAKKDIYGLPIVQACKNASGWEAEILTYTSNTIVLRVNTPCDGYLSSSEVYYPGWKASVDTMSTKIYRSNWAFRTIYVPKGEHTVVYYYQPTIYLYGILITTGTVFLVLMLYFRSQKAKH